MLPLETIFVETGSRPTMDKGGKTPAWGVNSTAYQDRNNWYNDDGINFFYNTGKVSNIYTTYIQYGRNAVGWASARFLQQSILITKEEPLEDGSIRLTGTMTAMFFRGKQTTTATAGFETYYKIKINNTTMYEFTENSLADFNKANNTVVPFNVVIPPEEYSSELLLDISITYESASGFDPNLFKVGVTFYNPNPKTYVPMAIRKSGTWKDLDSNNGKIQRRVNGTWTDKSDENATTSRQANAGKNRIRRSGTWRQLPKMSGGNAP